MIGGDANQQCKYDTKGRLVENPSEAKAETSGQQGVLPGCLVERDRRISAIISGY